jgi:biotin transport system substrate-specific component
VKFDVRDLARIAVFAAILAVLGIPGAIPVFGNAVPITAQTLGVMLAGAVLGAWRGAAAVVVFLLLVLVGLPLLSGGRGGASAFVGPSSGYLFGWILGAFVTGAIVHASIGGRGGRTPRLWRTVVGCLVGGVLAVYAVGIPVQALGTHLPLGATAVSSAVFLPGDLLKTVVATIVTMALWRAYPRAFGYEPRANPAAAAAATAAADPAANSAANSR